MSFVKSLFGGGADKKAKRAAEEARRAEEVRLKEAQRLEGIEVKKAEEIKIKEAGQTKRRLRRRAGGRTVLTSPLGVTGGGAVDSKVLLGL